MWPEIVIILDFSKHLFGQRYVKVAQTVKNLATCSVALRCFEQMSFGEDKFYVK